MAEGVSMTIDELREYAKTFPHQGGVSIGPSLEKYAAEIEPGSSIVEVGCWLGGGTAHLALGAMQTHAPIFTWDRFICVNEEEQGKAARFGIDFTIGSDTLPWVRERLDKFPAEINYNKGSWRKFTWDRGPIGLYVDDLTKSEDLWNAAMAAFLPHFIPGKTHLFLMDYNFDIEAGPKYAAQKRYMAANPDRFEMLGDWLDGTTTALFRFVE